MLFAAFCVLATLQADVTVQLTPIPKGANEKLGGRYRPQMSKLSPELPATLAKSPKDLVSPKYGTLAIGESNGICFILDEPAGAPARLFVDSNRNGDLTDDPAVVWTAEEQKAKDGSITGTMYKGSTMIDVGEAGKPWMVSLPMYRAKPASGEAKDLLSYYRDYAYEGEIEFGGKRFKTMLVDEQARADFRGKAPSEEEAKKGADSGVKLFVDLNANGMFDARGEKFDVLKPFNIRGTTWEIAGMARTGASFKLVKSKLSVAEISDHTVGSLITAFATVDTEAKALSFPGDYKGKVVLIDFWATWCGPCMKEMPHVVAAYEKYHADGFEVLGVSLDNEKSISKMPDVMKRAGMTWRQVADGKGWGAEIAQLYGINSIPATFLVDGTTGKVIGANLRGEALGAALEQALHGKKPAQ